MAIPRVSHFLCATVISSLAIVGCSALPSPEPRAQVHLTLIGDDSMQSLAQSLANVYTQQRPYVTISVQPADSDFGLSSVSEISGTIGLISRVVKPSELVGTRAIVVGRDGIAVIVNRANTINAIMASQIAQVFSGEISAWPAGAVAGKMIQVVSREDGSDTRRAFEAMAMGGQRVTPTAIVMPGEAAVVDYVSQHPEAIGYCSMSVLTPGVQAMTIDDVALTIQTVESQKYPFVRSLAFVVPATAEPDVQEFVDFVLSADGQKIVSERYGRAP